MDREKGGIKGSVKPSKCLNSAGKEAGWMRE